MALSAVVVIPARDEEATITTCLEALARQTVGRSEFAVVLVADACVDATAAVAAAAADRLGLELVVLTGPGAGTGPARQLGMDAAAALLRERGDADGLIATTDADSVTACDWLARQLAHVAEGARVVAGFVELEPGDLSALPNGVLMRRERDAARRMARVSRQSPDADHHHFAGASLGLTADVYQEVGGLEAVPALEDEALAARLASHRVPVLHASDVRVRTSARSDGRARRGLSVDLAVSRWIEQRRYRAEDFSPELLGAVKGTTKVSVVIPTKECADTVGGVLRSTVAPWRELGLVDHVLIVDAASDDGTAAGAEASAPGWVDVRQQDDLLPEYGPVLGKGDAMWRALSATDGDIICFLDGDTGDPDPRHLQGLLGPLLTDPAIAFVKGSFERPLLRDAVSLPNEGGRVTELMARPLLNLHEPRLAGFTQPLAGEFSGRRPLFESLPFPVGYGVEIAILIDALRAEGLDALAECHLGTRQNRHQPLRALGEMAFAVLAAVERRLEGPRSATGGHYLRPWEDGTVARVPIDERPPLSSLANAPRAVAADRR